MKINISYLMWCIKWNVQNHNEKMEVMMTLIKNEKQKNKKKNIKKLFCTCVLKSKIHGVYIKKN